MACVRPERTTSVPLFGEQRLALTNFRIKVGEHWYTVQVGDLTHSPVQVTVEGETFEVDVEGLPSQSNVRPRRGRSRQAQIETPAQTQSSAANYSDDILRSPMPGRVISILVRPGDQVATGDEVCVVEAMKMEQSIRAHRDGVVKTVFVQPMDPVKADDPLVELE